MSEWPRREPCRACGGTGRVRRRWFGRWTTCPACDGTGVALNFGKWRDIKVMMERHDQIDAALAAESMTEAEEQGTVPLDDVMKEGEN